MSGTIERYSFEDADGVEQSYVTSDPTEAKDYAKQYALRVIAHIYAWESREVVPEWDFTESDDND